MVTVLGERGYLGAIVKRRWLELGDSEHVINCIRPDDIDLTYRLAETGCLIQPSSDAIAEDTVYGRTKRAIEHAPGAVTIRAGIVDIRHEPVVAFTNWYCNPLTPLEWAEYAWAHRDEPGVHAIGREPLTRYEVERVVANLWHRPVPDAGMGAPLDRVQPSIDLPPLWDALTTFREWLLAGGYAEPEPLEVNG